jgi:hypothetical protein
MWDIAAGVFVANLATLLIAGFILLVLLKR